MQINDEKYKQSADSNAFLKKTVYPSRGLIYDRNGELVVFNQPAYDVMLIPRDVQPFDTLDFCETINITLEQFNKRMADMKDKRLNPGYSSYTPSALSQPVGRRLRQVAGEAIPLSGLLYPEKDIEAV